MRLSVRLLRIWFYKAADKSMPWFRWLTILWFAPLAMAAQTISSPNGQLTLKAYVSKGQPTYELFYGDEPVVNPSHLGLELANFPSLLTNFEVASVDSSSFDETWKPVWGEKSAIRNRYNELAVRFKERTAACRDMVVRFRLYDEGVGFRYELPRQPQLDNVIVKEERTQFAMPGNHQAYWIAGDYDTNEYDYQITRLSEIRQRMPKAVTPNATQSPIGPTAVQTALLMKTDAGLYINIHEAALVNYSAMHLVLNDTTMVFESCLTPDALGQKACIRCPFNTPWRTIMVSNDPRTLLDSKLTLNLNEPCKLEDTSWIHPVKYIGVWWEMITGKSTWSYADYQPVVLGQTNFAKLKPTGRHGADSTNVKRYIDFAARHGFSQVLVEGWNEGWEDNWRKLHNYSFTQAYPDYPLRRLQAYAQERGVKLMMHHETSSSVLNYERQLDDAYKLMNRHGIDVVKSGYVGDIFPNGGHHFDQWMVEHYLHCIKEAAKHRIMVNAHEAVRPTGLCRTYPNMIGNESARGTEFHAMEGCSPGHVAILPFTRLMGGPMDYTPGIFETDISKVNPNNKCRMRATLCNQLALYVVLYSPLQMAADLPENYEKHLDAFQFIKDVAVDWDDSHYLEAEPGEYITVARKAKGSPNWFVGCVAGLHAHMANVSLSFLEPGKKYVATIYKDGAKADIDKLTADYVIEQRTVTHRSNLRIRAVKGGGFAISIKPLERGEKVKKVKK